MGYFSRSSLCSFLVFCIIFHCCAINLLQAQVLLTATGTNGAFLVQYPANLTSVPSGIMVTFFSNHDVYNNCSLNLNGTGAKPVLKNVTYQLADGDILQGQPVSVIYDGNNWHLLSTTALHSEPWTLNGTKIFPTNLSDNVGIGTSTPNAPLQFANSIGFRKLVLSDFNNNDHQFYGLGLTGGVFRYQVDSPLSRHVFYAGTSTATSDVLMTIQGNGNVGIGTVTPNSKLDISGGAIVINSTIGNSARPPISNLRINGEISAYGTASGDLSSNQGFLRLSAGGGTNGGFKSFIDISGASTLPDMLSNLVFGTGGTEKMRIDAYGKVGIGTVSPNARLQVNHDYDATGPNASFNQPVSTWGSTALFRSYRFIQTSSSATDGNFKELHVGAGGIAIGYSTTPGYNSGDALYVNGSVGVGTASPNALLDIKGGAIVINSIVGNGSARPPLTNARINGEISAYGIGGGTFASDDGFLRLSAGGGTNATNKSYIDLTGYSSVADMSNNIVFGCSGTEKVRIDYIGNVGIGRTAPNARLSVSNNGSELSGTAHSNTFRTYSGSLGATLGNEERLSSFGFNSGNNSSFGITAYRSAAGTSWTTTAILLEMDVDNTPRVSNSYIALNANGNVGIGTPSPSYKLQIQNGDAFIQGIPGFAANGDRANLYFGDNNNLISAVVGSGLRFSTYNTPDMVTFQQATGNVGIGTTNPTTAKLVIAGSAGSEGLDLSTSDQYANLRVLRNSNGSDKDMYIGYLSGASSSLHLYSNNSETVTVKSGYVGIGTSGPTTLLDINGSFRARATDGLSPYDNIYLTYASFSTGSPFFVNTASLYPSMDGRADLGGSLNRFRNIYVQNVINTSDIRTKQNLSTLRYGLKEIMQLNPVHYKYKSDSSVARIGFIAQEIKPLIPEMVDVGKDTAATLGLKYSEITPVLVKAIQQQQYLIESQTTEIAALKLLLKARKEDHDDLRLEIKEIKNHLGLWAEVKK